MRQVVLDTETTGLEPAQGHRVIEIGGVEMIDRRHTGRHFHVYLQPDRDIDAGAEQVHGITAAFLRDKPRFAEVVDDFMEFISGAELVIHNAPFDVGFLNSELAMLGHEPGAVEAVCTVLDTLALARQLHPGQRNSLDALCKRYAVDNSQRELHGALLDAQILADVYLAMTGGQTLLELSVGGGASGADSGGETRHRVRRAGLALRIIGASEQECDAHAAMLARIERSSTTGAIWSKLGDGGAGDG